ncbi:MAG: DUF1566 domain-containing protein [Bacteroidaceae bacterium]|nr:DUF1566 domain-containing protein [Bacteroidaceae bacterium]
MKRLFAFTLLFQLVLLTAQAQKVEAKKCATCGKPIATCQYKGRHPKTNTTNSQATGKINGHEWVDLGLSVKWATCNVGANSPEDYGGYYAWGETSTKSNYTWDNCFDCLDDEGDSWSVYKIGGKTKLEPNSGHDTARQNWGGTWRMPTEKELEELSKKCTWKWTLKGDHEGYEVIGPNSNSIFLPAAGYRDGTELFCISGDSVLGGQGSYWSSTLNDEDSYDACYLNFWREGINIYSDGGRLNGFSVRPVTD